MADQYLLEAPENPAQDGTTEVVLDRDKNGEATKVISVSWPAELTQEDQKTLKNLGFKAKKASAEEVQEAQERAAATVGSDVAGAAPVLPEGGSNNDQDDK